MPRSIAIAGGGIAGLTTALALARMGVPAIILERNVELAREGGALMLWPNATRVLRALGLEAALDPYATEVRRLRVADSEAAALDDLDLDRLGCRAGSPTWMVRRRDLLGVLAEAVDRAGQSLRFEHEVTGLSERGDGVEIEIGGQSSLRADLLVAADGIHSRVRERLRGERRPRFAHHAAWVGESRMPEGAWPCPVGESLIAVGDHGRRLFATALDDDTRAGREMRAGRAIHWYVTEKRSAAADPRAFISPSALPDLFSDWRFPVAELIRCHESLSPFWIQDRPPSLAWGTDRIAFVGDAIHASTPDLGQGACQAIESAFVLAAKLTEPKTTTARALSSYRRTRMPRTARVNAASWATAIQSSISTPGAHAVRKWGMKSILPTMIRSEFRFLFEHGP